MSNRPAFKNKYITVWDSNWGLSITIEKSYKDKKTDSWKKSNKFFSNELPALKEAISELEAFLKEKEEGVSQVVNDFVNDDGVEEFL